MILAPRPPFRVSQRPPGGRYQRFQQAYRTTISRVLRRAPRATVQGVPSKATPPCRFPMSPPVLESQRGSSVRVSELAARIANQPRVGRQAGKPAPGWPPGWQTRPRASLHRDWHQGLFAAICCTSLHSGTQHKSLSQKSKTITTFGLWMPLKTELCCLPATFRKWTLS